jgi:hypothetical protein
MHVVFSFRIQPSTRSTFIASSEIFKYALRFLRLLSIGKVSQLDLSTGDHLPPSATRTNEESRHFPAPHKAAPSVHKLNVLPTRQSARF